jgi:HK97 family phage major capsid protein
VIGKMSPGQRAKLAALGLNESDIGRVLNRANPGTVAPQRVELPSGVTIPQNSNELAEYVADPERLKSIMSDRNVFYSFMAKYGEQQQGEGTELRATIAEESQRALINYLRENEIEGIKRINLDPQSTPKATMRLARQVIAGHNPDAPGAELDTEFASSGEFFRGVHAMSKTSGGGEELRAKMARIQNAYQSIVPADGGFLIPEVLRAQLLQTALEEAIVRPRAFNVPMESLRVALPTIDATTNVGSIMGGMVAYWTEEGAAMTESTAKFGQVQLEAKTLTGYAEVPNQLMADSIISFSAFIETAWPKAIAWFEDLAFLVGSGAGEPLGLIGANNLGAIAVAAQAGQQTNTILWENIVNMYARMLPSSLNNAVWIASPDTFPELATMALSVGTGGSAVWLGNGADKPPVTILGRPVIFTEKISRLGTRGDIVFADLSYYLVGDRQVMTAESSEHFRFNQNKTAFRIVERVDGRPWLQSAITPSNSGPTLSPFVELATRP